ncbi:MAG: tetratricopeptide (TPR) repeat protein, partial [Candidatus Krumholzibacteriia bacterium]
VGAALLFRGTAVVLLVPVVFALRPDRSFGSFRAAVWPAMVAMLIIILPFTVFNSMRAGRIAPPAMNGGVNLYIGNAPGATGFFEPILGFDAENDPSGAEYLSKKYGEKIIEPWAANQVWLQDGRQAILNDPLRTAGLWLRKVRLHFVAIEIPQISAVSTWQRQAPLLRALVVPWAFFAAAGLAGGILSWRRYPRLAPWLIAVLLLIAAQSLFFVVTRYRIILVPTLALASVAMLRELTRRQWRDFLLLAIAVALVWPWGLDGVRRNFKVGALENEAIRWEHTAKAAEPAAADLDLAEAESLYRESIAIADHRVDSWQGLGRVLWLRNEQAAAIETLTEGMEKVKVKQGLRDDLIAMLVRQGRLGEALPHLELALQDAPDNADHLHNAAVAMSEAGRPIESVTMAQNLIIAHPTDSRGYFDLGVLYARSGLMAQARDVFAAGLRQVPNHPELMRNLARVEEALAAEEEE